MIEASAPYYRFALAIEGEQDIIDTGRDDLEATVAQLEAGPDDPTEWEAQVHLERSGIICGGCRARLLAFLGGSPRAAH